MFFRDNTFTNVGSFPPAGISANDVHLGALVVAVQDVPENLNAMNPVFESLIFDSNTFNNLQGPGLYLSRANAVAVVNNRLTSTDLSKVDISLSATGLNGSIVVSHSRNVSHYGNSMDHAGPLWIDPKSTSGISAVPRH